MNVIIADDHEIFRQGLRLCLQAERRFQVIGEAGNGREAVALCHRLKPDLAILDLAMPEMNGVEATRRIAEAELGVRVIVLSMHADIEFIQSALDAGAGGYLLKTSALDELVAAIEAVSTGQMYITPSLKAALEAASAVTARPGPSPLSPREREVLQMLAEGLPVKTIAARLKVSPKTVHTFRARLMNKLQIDNIAELTRYAIQFGYTPLADPAAPADVAHPPPPAV
jgi:DNA-binding NarL/FixJ family response regulator